MSHDDITLLSHRAAIVLIPLYICFFLFFYGPHPFLGVSQGTTRRGITFSGLIGPATNYSLTQAAVLAKPYKMTALLALLGAIFASILSILCSLIVVETIDTVVYQFHVPKSFLGLIIIPAAMNAIEYLITATHARHREMDWTIQATIVSNIRTLLFILPLTIFLGWAIGAESMTLYFDGIQALLAFLTIIVVSPISEAKQISWYALVTHYLSAGH